MKGLLKTLGWMIIITALIAVGGVGGYVLHDCFEQEEVVAVEPSKDEKDLKLLGEVEKRVVTADEVKTKLIEIDELSTYAGEYESTLGKDEARYILEDLRLPGSTNSITIKCKGIVKIGYDVSDINVEVDDDKIYIAIPEAKLNDNYVIWDSVECNEKNNIINPINFSQYQEMIDEIEEKGLEDAKAKGVYERAEDNLKKVISGFLSDFSDYEIIYM